MKHRWCSRSDHFLSYFLWPIEIRKWELTKPWILGHPILIPVAQWLACNVVLSLSSESNWQKDCSSTCIALYSHLNNQQVSTKKKLEPIIKTNQQASPLSPSVYSMEWQKDSGLELRPLGSLQLWHLNMLYLSFLIGKRGIIISSSIAERVCEWKQAGKCSLWLRH